MPTPLGGWSGPARTELRPRRPREPDAESYSQRKRLPMGHRVLGGKLPVRGLLRIIKNEPVASARGSDVDSRCKPEGSAQQPDAHGQALSGEPTTRP